MHIFYGVIKILGLVSAGRILYLRIDVLSSSATSF